VLKVVVVVMVVWMVVGSGCVGGMMLGGVGRVVMRGCGAGH
jgi:hypothetical protein